MSRVNGERKNKDNIAKKISQQTNNAPVAKKQSEITESAENVPILSRLHPSQQADTLAAFGSTHGNRQLQRMVESMREPEPVAPAPASGGMQSVSSTVSMPFHASIKRSDMQGQPLAMPKIAALSRQDTSDDGRDKDSDHAKIFEKMVEEADKVLEGKKLEDKEKNDESIKKPSAESEEEPVLEDQVEKLDGKDKNRTDQKIKDGNENEAVDEGLPDGGKTELDESQLEALEPEVLEPFQLPDIEFPMLEEYEKNDAVAGNFSYKSSIKKDGPDPTGFGTTRSFNVRMTNIVITPTPGTFEVTATFERPITYQVRSGTGPHGQVDIKSETAPEITAANYQQVADDLKPNPGDLGGRSPRTQFWAEDLTLRHEEMHAKDDRDNGAKVMKSVIEWFEENSASGAADIWQLLNMIPAQFAVAALEEQSVEEAEKRAYGDGLSSYQQRASAIKQRGDGGKYT